MTARETRDYQRAQVALRALTYRDVAVLWRMLDLERLDDTFPKFATNVLVMVAQRRETSAALARTYIARLRTGVEGKAPAIPTPTIPTDDVLASLRFKSVISIKVAMTTGTPLPLASKNALVRTMGVVDKHVGDAGRDLILESVRIDPAASGWTRRALGTCDFCELLAGRTNNEGETFPRHDHCGCQPEPVYAATASRFSPEQLRNALDPSRKRTVAAIKKELEATAEGKDLLAEIKRFTETRGGVANLRKNIEGTLDGTASDAVQARIKIFLDAMNSYPTEDVPTLFRGIAVRVEEDTNAWWDAFEAQFQPGEHFSLNASSFTSSEKKAAEFSSMIGGTRKASGNYTAVRFVLEGDTHALPVEQLSKFKSEKEWITGGDFEVVSYQPASPKTPYYKVTVRQVKKLAAR